MEAFECEPPQISYDAWMAVMPFVEKQDRLSLAMVCKNVYQVVTSSGSLARYNAFRETSRTSMFARERLALWAIGLNTRGLDRANACYWAARSRNEVVLEWLQEHGFPWSLCMLSEAYSAVGYVDKIKSYVRQGFDLDGSINMNALMTCAVRGGHVGMMEYLVYVYHPGVILESELITSAISYVSVLSLKWLIKNGCPVEWENACQHAAKSNRALVLLNVLFEARPMMIMTESQAEQIIMISARHGRQCVIRHILGIKNMHVGGGGEDDKERRYDPGCSILHNCLPKTLHKFHLARIALFEACDTGQVEIVSCIFVFLEECGWSWSSWRGIDIETDGSENLNLVYVASLRCVLSNRVECLQFLDTKTNILKHYHSELLGAADRVGSRGVYKFLNLS